MRLLLKEIQQARRGLGAGWRILRAPMTLFRAPSGLSRATLALFRAPWGVSAA